MSTTHTFAHTDSLYWHDPSEAETEPVPLEQTMSLNTHLVRNVASNSGFGGLPSVRCAMGPCQQGRSCPTPAACHIPEPEPIRTDLHRAVLDDGRVFYVPKHWPNLGFDLLTEHPGKCAIALLLLTLALGFGVL